MPSEITSPLPATEDPQPLTAIKLNFFHRNDLRFVLFLVAATGGIIALWDEFSKKPKSFYAHYKGKGIKKDRRLTPKRMIGGSIFIASALALAYSYYSSNKVII